MEERCFEFIYEYNIDNFDKKLSIKKYVHEMNTTKIGWYSL